MKGIKTILGILAVAGMFFSVNATAQENANRDENGKVVRGAYETNRLFDNFFIGIGGGVNAVAIKGQGFGNIGAAAEFNFGKWFTPSVGTRVMWHGLVNNTKTVEGWVGPRFQNHNHFAFNEFRMDALWNISNALGGYKETRFWDFIPYVGGGVLFTEFIDGEFFSNPEFALNLGLLNELRLGKRINLMIDLGVIGARASAFNPTYEKKNDVLSRIAFFPTATLGLSFNIGKTNFDRHTSITPVVIPVPFTEDEYNALVDKVAALEKENAELKDKIAALEEENAKYRNLKDGQTYLYQDGEFIEVAGTVSGPVTLYFNIGETKLTERELAHLEFYTDNVLKSDSKIDVNGYADSQTGSAKRNQYLSEKRVEYVVDLLKKAGAKEENISSAAHGSSTQPFNSAAKNRVVTVEVK
ncbi:MAG: OmpA family protein [Bacteroidales bacterium]|nr:OmpA family protein [Bacteroidales bacterium]